MHFSDILARPRIELHRSRLSTQRGSVTRFLLILIAALALAISAASVGVDRAAGGSVQTTACARRTVAANAAQWAAAQKSFADAFTRIRTYLLNPTIANQTRMYARADATLFQFYSYESGLLNSNKGKVSGRFTWSFVTGSQCFSRTTKEVSFRVHLKGRFTSRNKESLVVAELADVKVKAPRITYYQRVPGH
jgi:hypothetical protein